MDWLSRELRGIGRREALFEGGVDVFFDVQVIGRLYPCM